MNPVAAAEHHAVATGLGDIVPYDAVASAPFDHDPRAAIVAHRADGIAGRSGNPWRCAARSRNRRSTRAQSRGS